MEGSIRNSFCIRCSPKGGCSTLTTKPSPHLCARLHAIGERDSQLKLLAAACMRCPPSTKPTSGSSRAATSTTRRSGFSTRPTRLAKIEVLGARLLADREVLPQAMKLNPAFFKIVYTDLLNAKKTAKSVQAALAAVDGYLAARTPALFGPVIDHLREVGEARSATEIEDHFQRNFGIEGVTGACEYLADRGIIGKAASARRN